MINNNSYKFIVRLDIKYIDSPPLLEKIENELINKLKELKVDGLPIDVNILAKVEVKK